METDTTIPTAGAPLTEDGVRDDHARGTEGGEDGVWEELVTSALLGTDRRVPARFAGLPAGDLPGALLDAAALHTVRRRAGLRPGPAAPPPEPAPEDHRLPLPGAARRRLDQLLAGRTAPSPAGRRGAAPDLTELLPQWLALANERGYQAPAAALPALLDAARARTDLRPQALRLAAPRRARAAPSRTRGTRTVCAPCGTRACSPSGSPCSAPYGRRIRRPVSPSSRPPGPPNGRRTA